MKRVGSNNKSRGYRVVADPFRSVAVLLLGAVLSLLGCSKVGNAEVGNGNNGSGDFPEQSCQLKVQTSVQTRSAVDGTVLPKGSAIGVVVTTTDGSSFFTPSVTSGSGSADGGYYPDGRNVRFCNETGVNTWTSTTVDGKTRLLLFSNGERGKVYGYYPWTADGDIEGTGSSATVPVGILREGTIDVHGMGGSDKAATAEGEKDYMYSSRNDEVGTATTTTARLVMEHVLARVSFRMYVSAAAQAAVDGDEGSYYEFTGYTLRNRNGSDDLVARFDGNTRMKVSTGEITGALSGGEYVRRIEGYRLERSKGNTPDDDNSVASASPRVGHLCFPLASIAHDGGKTTGLEVVFEVRRMRGGGTVASGPAAYALPLAVEVGKSDKWEAGKHYLYTVKFTGSSLSIESVTVTDWNEVVGGDMNIGEDPYVSSVTVSPEGDIPVQGGPYSVTLTGFLPADGVQVRANISGAVPVTGKVTASGKAVELAVPANYSYNERSVSFEYKWGDEWKKIEPDKEDRKQRGWTVDARSHNAPATIPGQGGTYSVTLTGFLPADGVQVRANISRAAPVTGKVTASGTPVTLDIPANTTGGVRTVTFEYRWNNIWTGIGDKCSQEGLSVGDLYGGGVVYWVNPDNATDFRVVALDESKKAWAANTDYVLGEGARSQTERNGAAIMTLARQYSANHNGGASGVFATDFPAFAYCYNYQGPNNTDPQGTWYLPSKLELTDLYAAKGSVESVITANGGTAFLLDYWSATEYSSSYAWLVNFSDGYTDNNGFETTGYYVRCVRGK